jgi:hypothetical protein
MVLDRDHGVLEVGRDLFERNVTTLVIEPEPRAAGGIVEDGVADAAVQAVDGPRVPRRPGAHHEHADDEERAGGGEHPLTERQAAER